MRLDRFASIANSVAGSLPEGGLSRRTFLSAGAAAGGGLLLSFSLPEFMSNAEAADAKGFAPSAFIRIGRDGRVTLIINRVDMGQGTYTSMPMLIAEELEVDLRKVHVEHAPPDDKLYGNPRVGFQMTGGSSSCVFSGSRSAESGPRRGACWYQPDELHRSRAQGRL
jgi:CO/xanthine dehydrogenase Mo-binding subunit